jgi:ribonuclease Z
MKHIISSLRSYSSNKNLVDLLIKMPKDTTEHVVRNQKQRIRIREKSKHYSPGTVNLQILGSGARGSSAAVYLFSEQARWELNFK